MLHEMLKVLTLHFYGDQSKFQAQVEENKESVDEFTRTISGNNEEIEKLKLEIVNTIKRADAAHTRELNTQEVIENLRLNVTQLNQEIEQKNRQIAASEE